MQAWIQAPRPRDADASAPWLRVEDPIRSSGPGDPTMIASTSGNAMQDYDVRLVTLTIGDR